MSIERRLDLPADGVRQQIGAVGPLPGEVGQLASEVAVQGGSAAFENMTALHEAALGRERAKGIRAFAARRRAAERLGLAAVKSHRLKLLDEDEGAWTKGLHERSLATPELTAIVMVRVGQAGAVN